MKEQALLLAVANMYYHYLNYQINKDMDSKAIYNKCVNLIKLLTNIKKKEIEELFITCTIYNQPIKTIYNRFKYWL